MFVGHRYDNSSTAYRYLCGLVQSVKGNMERMEEVVSESDYEVLQQFISSSPWSARDVINKVAVEADDLLGGGCDVGLLIDESGFAKKGKSSVGVSRQWNGQLGKLENSQVAVFGALSSGHRVIPVDVALFLPKEWTDDEARCEKAGIPEAECKYRSKIDLALEIIHRQRELGVRFDYISADGLYGNSGEFCCRLDDLAEQFVVHVHADRRVYLSDPRPVIPTRKSEKGQSPSRLKAQCEPIRVDKLGKQLNKEDWKRVSLRQSTTGQLEVDIHHRQVWIWDGEEKQARSWQLLIRREIDNPKEIKYCLSNANEQVPAISLARRESQRFWIERAFEDGKQEASMADYQVRGWLAWYHHMALVMVAMLFMTRYRMLFAEEKPLLSCYDIKILLAHFLPSRNQSTDEILRQLERRHHKRRAASESAVRRRARDKL